MTKKFKKILVGLVASAMCVTGSMGAISASATIVDDYTAGADKYWYARHIGNGAPTSEDRQSRFYVFYSSGGHKGDCTSLTSYDTTFSVVATCVSSHTVNDQVWNGTGPKSWNVSGSTAHVRYNVYATGYYTISEGHIWRV